MQNIQKTILKTVARKILPTQLFEQVALKFSVREAFSFSTIAGGLKSGGLDILAGFLQSSKVPDSGIVRDHLRRNPSAIIFPFLMDTRGQTAGSWLNYCQTEVSFGFTLKSVADKVIAESEHNFNSLKASVEAAPQDFRKLAIQNANEKKNVAESTEVKIITQPLLLKTPVKK